MLSKTSLSVSNSETSTKRVHRSSTPDIVQKLAPRTLSRIKLTHLKLKE